MNIAFISGHLDLTQEEFNEHYIPKIQEAIGRGDRFVVGDAKGTDTMAQAYLLYRDLVRPGFVSVYHMFENPRNNVGDFEPRGGFKTDEDRDSMMTAVSDYDIAWVRPGREKSGTAKNLERRKSLETMNSFLILDKNQGNFVRSITNLCDQFGQVEIWSCSDTGVYLKHYTGTDVFKIIPPCDAKFLLDFTVEERRYVDGSESKNL